VDGLSSHRGRGAHSVDARRSHRDALQGVGHRTRTKHGVRDRPPSLRTLRGSLEGELPAATRLPAPQGLRGLPVANRLPAPGHAVDRNVQCTSQPATAPHICVGAANSPVSAARVDSNLPAATQLPVPAACVGCDDETSMSASQPERRLGASAPVLEEDEDSDGSAESEPVSLANATSQTSLPSFHAGGAGGMLPDPPHQRPAVVRRTSCPTLVTATVLSQGSAAAGPRPAALKRACTTSWMATTTGRHSTARHSTGRYSSSDSSPHPGVPRRARSSSVVMATVLNQGSAAAGPRSAVRLGPCTTFVSATTTGHPSATFHNTGRHSSSDGAPHPAVPRRASCVPSDAATSIRIESMPPVNVTSIDAEADGGRSPMQSPKLTSPVQSPTITSPKVSPRKASPKLMSPIQSPRITSPKASPRRSSPNVSPRMGGSTPRPLGRDSTREHPDRVRI